MKMLSQAVAAGIVLAGLASTAHAVPITYTITANEYLSLGLVASAVPVPISVTGTGNTADEVTLAPGVIGVPLSSVSFSTPIGGGTIVTPLDFVTETAAHTGGFFTSGLDSILAESATFFTTYDDVTGADAIAGLPADSVNVAADVTPASPLESQLIFGEGGNNYSFTATTANTVPEPGTVALLGMGLLTLGLIRARNTGLLLRPAGGQ